MLRIDRNTPTVSHPDYEEWQASMCALLRLLAPAHPDPGGLLWMADNNIFPGITSGKGRSCYLSCAHPQNRVPQLYGAIDFALFRHVSPPGRPKFKFVSLCPHTLRGERPSVTLRVGRPCDAIGLALIARASHIRECPLGARCPTVS